MSYNVGDRVVILTGVRFASISQTIDKHVRGIAPVYGIVQSKGKWYKDTYKVLGDDGKLYDIDPSNRYCSIAVPDICSINQYISALNEDIEASRRVISDSNKRIDKINEILSTGMIK